GLRVQDLVGEVFRRPRGRFRSSTFDVRFADVLQGGAAFAAETLTGFVRRAAGRAGYCQRRTATGAALSPFPILPSAGRAGHGDASWRCLVVAPGLPYEISHAFPATAGERGAQTAERARRAGGPGRRGGDHRPLRPRAGSARGCR